MRYGHSTAAAITVQRLRTVGQDGREVDRLKLSGFAIVANCAWQADCERRAGVWRGLHVDCAAVTEHNFTCDEEAQA